MAKKVMVIGLGPEYNYNIKDHSQWSNDNTKFASNHGASLISRTLMEFFDADYIDVNEPLESVKGQYELCVIAFATHITEWRDVSKYADFIEQLGIKTVAFSLGIQDYSSDHGSITQLHSSILRLLKYVLSTSKYIGVRGPHTASLLIKSGISSQRIIYFGCPTMYRSLDRNLKITKKANFENPLVVYHRTMKDLNLNLTDCTLLGQDFLDEVIFEKGVPESNPIKKIELDKYKESNNGKILLERIQKNGKFNKNFDAWFKTIGSHDFVFGARLHGCIAALIQGIPAVMLARDIRVAEIATFYKIPYIKYEDIGTLTIQEIYDQADFTEFNDLYAKRFDNFLCLMKKLEIEDYLSFPDDYPDTFIFTEEDVNANNDIIYAELVALRTHLTKLKNEFSIRFDRNEKQIYHIKKNIKKIPGINLVKRLLK